MWQIKHATFTWLHEIRIEHHKVVRVTSSRAESHSDDAGTGVVFEARLAILMLLGEIVVKRRNCEVKNERLPSFLGEL